MAAFYYECQACICCREKQCTRRYAWWHVHTMPWGGDYVRVSSYTWLPSLHLALFRRFTLFLVLLWKIPYYTREDIGYFIHVLLYKKCLRMWLKSCLWKIKNLYFYIFRLFWCTDIKNNFFLMKKNIILIYF